MTLLAKEKASLTEQEVAYKNEKREIKREINILKLNRERELSELLTQEMNNRIRF